MKRAFLVLLSFVLIGASLYADAGNKRVQIDGKILASTPKMITPRQLEKDVGIFKVHLYNPWDKKAADYEGVLIDQLVKRYGQKDISRLKLKAIDNYEVDLSKDLWSKERILLVTKINGKYIPVSEKGPLRIVFVDYNDKKAEHLDLWMWMIKKITFY